MSEPCQTARIGTTTLRRGTTIPSLDLLVTEQETIRGMPTTMEQVTPYILDLVAVNTIITATDIKYTYLNVICGSHEKANSSNGQEQK